MCIAALLANFWLSMLSALVGQRIKNDIPAILDSNASINNIHDIRFLTEIRLKQRVAK
jgi:hypothetical protein